MSFFPKANQEMQEVRNEIQMFSRQTGRGEGIKKNPNREYIESLKQFQIGPQDGLVKEDKVKPADNWKDDEIGNLDLEES